MQRHNSGALKEIVEHPFAFSLVFMGFFVLAFVFLASVGATPDTKVSSTDEGSMPLQTVSPAGPEMPVRITAASIGLDAKVNNPTSTDVSALDQSLLSGAVRYPTSAELGEEGTVLLFGHSSYLPIVYNQAYKTFDGIQNLKTGETVSVYSATAEYRYRVSGVRVANANEDVIELPRNGKRLTLVTCNSFAAKTSRFVVTADFVGAYSLTSN